MWIMTSFGAFFPAVRPPHTIAEGDEKVMQIRARRRIDLKRLRRHYMPDLGPTYAIKGSDYQVRAHCTRAALADGLVAIAADIDYEKFKPTTIDLWRDGQLHDAYLNVWAVLLTDLSPRRRRRTRQWTPPGWDR